MHVSPFGRPRHDAAGMGKAATQVVRAAPVDLVGPNFPSTLPAELRVDNRGRNFAIPSSRNVLRMVPRERPILKSAIQPTKFPPEVTGWRSPSSNVTTGLRVSVQVVSEKFVSCTGPSRQPAAPSIDPVAPSWPDVHGALDVGDVIGALVRDPPSAGSSFVAP